MKIIYWSLLKTFFILAVILFFLVYMVHILLIRRRSDIAMNLGPNPNLCHSLSGCHENVNFPGMY